MCTGDVDRKVWMRLRLAGLIASAQRSMSLNAAVPTIARSAPARSASRTASTVRRPPPYWIGTPVAATIRRR